MIENGSIGVKKVVDFGAFLGLEIAQDKWLAWGKGKPLLIRRSRFSKPRYTYIITPEIGWTLDGDSIVNVLVKGKALFYPDFNGKATYKVQPNGKQEPISVPKLESALTRDEVGEIIDEKLNNGFSKKIQEIVEQAISGLKIPSSADAPTPPSPQAPPTNEPKQEPPQTMTADQIARAGKQNGS